MSFMAMMGVSTVLSPKAMLCTRYRPKKFPVQFLKSLDEGHYVHGQACVEMAQELEWVGRTKYTGINDASRLETPVTEGMC